MQTTQTHQHKHIWLWSIVLAIALFFGFQTCNLFQSKISEALLSWPLIIFIIAIIKLIYKKPIKALSYLILALFFWTPYFQTVYPEMIPDMSSMEFYKKYWFIPISLIAIINLVKLLIVGPNTNTKSDVFHPIMTENSSTSNKKKIYCDTAFSATSKKIITEDFEGGNIKVAFGAQVIDLKEATFSQVQTPTLNIEVSFGNCKIFLPQDCQIILNIKNNFGGINNHATYNSTSNQKIILNGSVAFGSLDIFN